ncbi:MAG: ribonuclease D [Actinobacteria bacterium]|nr:ribonuclease D [Actinomycetota bacterium]
MATERFLTSQSDVDELVEAAHGAGRVGLDTEFMREKTYRARLCLLQVATPDDLVLIDPLENVDLKGVGDLVSSPDVEVVVHAGRQDFELFYEGMGAVPKRVFDIQVAAGFAGIGASLPYNRLIEETVGANVDKGESYTDWCQRPLTEAQLHYAANDVRYLLEAAAVLKEKLKGMARLEWVEEELLSFEKEELYSADPAEAWRRVSGKGSLRGKHLSILREVARWREETAARRDIPRGWVLKDQTLVEIARRSPANAGDLGSIRGLNAKEAERSGGGILQAIEKGKRGPAIEATSSPPRAAQIRARMLTGLADAIVRSRCEHAEIATELVATRGDLEALLADVFSNEHHLEKHRLMRGWRRDLAGEAVVALAEGRVAVRAIEDPPYIEEVYL